ncbi:porin family protein [Hymenobacter setariae]|uniref:Porin family protein n=1 Tax=Hymenobacter setariae TaxID=2594794 RepID=A0A558BPY7_9BACT|nr:porin family protein [Hymenobacter setariae]
MFLYKLLSASLLAGILPLVSAAQTTPDSPRYYVGVGGSMLNSFGSGSSRIFGPSLTAGLQLKPRLAVQVGTTVTWRNYSSSFITTDAQQRQTVYTNTSHSNFITVPALLRYTLTPAAAAKRLQVDALVGISLLINTSRSTSRTLYPDQTQYESSNRYSNLRSSLVLGPALRYSLTPQVALTAEVPINLEVSSAYGLRNSLFYNLQVGARYNFG